MLEKLKKRNFIEVVIGLLVLILLALAIFFGYKFYVSKQLRLNIDEKNYYIHSGVAFDIPTATAYDKEDNKLNVVVTIYKDGKKVDSIDTRHVGDEYTIYYETTDGKLSLKKHIVVKIISNPSSLKYEIVGITSVWTNQDVTLTFVPLDNNIEQYCFDSQCSTNNTVKVTKNGQYETYVIDKYDNSSEKKEITVANIDKVNPKIKGVNEYTKSGQTYLGITATDNESGVKEYSFDNGKTYGEISTIKLTDNITIKIRVKDAAGNVSETYTYEYVVEGTKLKEDNQSPTFTVSKLPSNEWSNSNVTVTVNATDNMSGVKEYSFDNGGTWQLDNTKIYEATANIKVKVKDNTGNISQAKDLSIKIDKIAPIINNIINQYSYISDVTFEVVEDNLDTVIVKRNDQKIEYTTTLSESGTYSIAATDKAGNETIVIFNIIKGQTLITGVENGAYYNYNVTPEVLGGTTLTMVTLTKGESPIEDYAIGNTISQEGSYTLYVEDENTNSDEVTFTIDKTDPEILSEISSTNDNTILTARDYSLDTVVLSEDGDPIECFAETEKEESGLDCTVTDYLDMDIYKMLEYGFETNDSEYTVLATDKAGNETNYDMDSDIIPIYTIDDLEAIGSNAARTINNKDYFMSSVASYRLMNDLDYENTRYNQIVAQDMVNPDDSIDYYTLRWKERNIKVEQVEYPFNNLSLATIVDSETSEGAINHVEITIGDITYVNLDISTLSISYFMDSGESVEFNKIKINDDYVDLDHPVRILCGPTMSGSIACNVESDETKVIPYTMFCLFEPDFYNLFSSSDDEIVYSVPMPIYDEETDEEIMTTFYYKVNASDGSLIGVFDGEDNDITSSVLDDWMIPTLRMYERQIGNENYLIYQFVLGNITVTSKDYNIMLPKSLLNHDSSYIYFEKDGVQYRIRNDSSYSTNNYYSYSNPFEALEALGHISVDHMEYCSLDCSNEENWQHINIEDGDYAEIYLYTKQNWFMDIRYELPDGEGIIWDNKLYLGYGYGDGDIKPNKFYIDKYKEYFIIKYRDNWYKCNISDNVVYIFNEQENMWKITDSIQFYLKNYDRENYLSKFTDLPLSISFDGNGYKISNLTNSSTLAITDGQHEGLFNYLKNSVIKNLTFDNAGLYGFKDVTDVKMGILADFVRSSTIRNIAITNANIYPTNNEMGILIGKAWNSEIVDNTINASIHAGDLTYPSAATKLAGLVSSTINSNIIGNSLDITNYAQGMSGLVYRASAVDEGTEKPNVYNVYLKDNNIKYRNRSKVTFNTIYSELSAGGSYHVNLSNNTLDISNFGSYLDGSVIYFNPITGAVCDASQVNYTALFSVGCMKWYTFGDNDSNTSVNLLMDVNIGYIFQGAWASSTNVSGPTTILTVLKSTTDDWLGVSSRTDSYTVNNGTANYTIDYSGYRARLIQASEIATITGNTSFNENTSNIMFYYETNTATIPSPAVGKYSWLYGTGTKPYYTATAVAGNSYRVWSVGTKSLFLDNLGSEEDTGIRPVITVPKSVLQ